MDTSVLENIAELKIAHELQKHNILIAKPYFDQNGTDLLAFSKMEDGVKFCRVQCKGRTVKKDGKNGIEILKDYVSGGFIVFLYVDFGDFTDQLYMFHASEIEEWNLSPDNEYTLSLSDSNLREKLEKFIFNYSKVEILKHIIEVAEYTNDYWEIIQDNNFIAKS